MKYVVTALLLLAVVTPASAQMMKGEMKMKAPTTKQCQMGYKMSYMKSMKWSKANFRKACSDKMMMMKKKKMM